MSESTSRRALLGAGMGALLTSIAAALGRPSSAQAANGDPVMAGRAAQASNTTSIQVSLLPTHSPYGAFAAVNFDGVGMAGVSRSGTGVFAESETGDGVAGFSTERSGVLGRTTGVETAGVLGQARLESSSGVEGINLATGTRGQLGTAGFGVVGTAPDEPGRIGVLAFGLDPAIALAVEGRATFSRSGKASLARGRSFIDVEAPGGLTAVSLVLAVPMVNRAGVYVQSVVPNVKTGVFRINLNKIASPSASTAIAWFIVN